MGNNKISAGTIARTVILALALANQIMTAFGHSGIDVSNDDINNFIATAFTIAAAVAAWWKNNSFTQAAIAGDQFKQGVKNGIIGETKEDGMS